MGDFKGPCDQCRIASMASPPLTLAMNRQNKKKKLRNQTPFYQLF
jgi:hypothetical protein